LQHLINFITHEDGLGFRGRLKLLGLGHDQLTGFNCKTDSGSISLPAELVRFRTVLPERSPNQRQ
jgi:hypothetical protein